MEFKGLAFLAISLLCLSDPTEAGGVSICDNTTPCTAANTHRCVDPTKTSGDGSSYADLMVMLGGSGVLIEHCCICLDGFHGPGCGTADASQHGCMNCDITGVGAVDLCTDYTAAVNCSTSGGSGNCTETSTDAKCFPAKSVVTIYDEENGKEKEITMEEIGVGDEVLSVEPNDLTLIYDKVYMMSHADPDQLVEGYMKISTLGGRIITISPGHYMWRANTGLEMVRGGDIQVGDKVIMVSGSSDGEMVADEVMEVEKVRAPGMFSPHTLRGNIIVNGIAATTYTDLLPPWLEHEFMWPVRQLFMMSGGIRALAKFSQQMLVRPVVELVRGSFK